MTTYHFRIGQHVRTPAGWGVIVGQVYLSGEPIAIVDVDGVRHPYSEAELMQCEAAQVPA
jgi:hypothetical protein